MSDVVVLGRGQMGKPIADAMRKFGHAVWTIDTSNGPDDDCVYVNTCPNKADLEPADCGSFQWKSG